MKTINASQIEDEEAEAFVKSASPSTHQDIIAGMAKQAANNRLNLALVVQAVIANSGYQSIALVSLFGGNLPEKEKGWHALIVRYRDASSEKAARELIAATQEMLRTAMNSHAQAN